MSQLDCSKHDKEENALRKNALGVGFIIFFVVSAASPLSVIAGGFPIGIMLGNGPGTPALLVLILY